jgi:hypothetical protein
VITNANVSTLLDSIRTQTEQNRILQRVFSELEKDLRNMTDTRLALEIQLDYLNSASSSVSANPANPNNNNNNNNNSNSSSKTTTTPAVVKQPSIGSNSSSVQATPVSALSQSASNPTNLSGKVLQLDNVTGSATTNTAMVGSQQHQHTPIVAVSAANSSNNTASSQLPAPGSIVLSAVAVNSSQIMSKSTI